jgi:uncharacterized Zn finger protein (UPF0148 family)
VLSLLVDDELKCASCLKEQNSADNIEDEIFYTNIDPDDPTKCNHRFCSRCKVNNFNKKRNFACPICQSIVKESNLKQQTYDDYEIKRDIKIRKKIKSIYNKTETDFKTLIEYQDYDEYREDIIYNLVHNINKDETEKLIKDYESSHMKEIAKKQIELDHYNKLIEERIALEDEEKKLKNIQYHENLKNNKLKEIEFKKNMNNYVISGEGDYTTLSLPPASASSPFNANVVALKQPTSSSVATTGASSAIHPLYILLGQRAEPKPITANISQPMSSHVSKTVVHTAGGFNFNIYLDRNMREILSCFDSKINLASSRRKYRFKDTSASSGSMESNLMNK